VFYYHRRVPRAAVASVGKKIITFSLYTRDPKAAKKLRDIEDVLWNARFEAKEPDGPNPSDGSAKPAGRGLIRLVQEYVAGADEAARMELLTDLPESMDEKSERKRNAETVRAALKNIDDPRGAAWVTGMAAELSGEDLSTWSPKVAALFGEIVRRGLLELQNRNIARLDDDFSRPFFDPIFNSEGQAQAPKVTFGQVADQFLELTEDQAGANGTSRKWVDKQRANVATLKEIVGEAIAITEVDFDACMRVRSALAAIPANRSKVYGSVPVLEATRRANLDGKALLSSVTQDQYLATFRAILDLAAKKRLVGVNPAAGLKPLKKDRVSAADKRLPFTPLQLSGFFQGSYYRNCAQQAAPAYTHDKGGWRFWMPLIALYMGMRPNEVCQLSASDVKRTTAGTWYIDVVVSDDEDDHSEHVKTLKTAASRRRIPIHPEIIAIGFVEFAAKRKISGKTARLFPELQPDEYGNYAKYALKRFRETFMPEEIMLGNRQTFYSLRHNFRDALRRADAPPDALQALGGWSQGSLVSDRYGDRDNPDYQARFMAAVSYPELDLSFLYSKETSGTRENPGDDLIVVSDQ
jgi:integrase